MASKLLIIESQMGSSVPTEFRLPLPCQRTTWSEFTAHEIDTVRTQLILAGASREGAP